MTVYAGIRVKTSILLNFELSIGKSIFFFWYTGINGSDGKPNLKASVRKSALDEALLDVVHEVAHHRRLRPLVLTALLLPSS